MANRKDTNPQNAARRKLSAAIVTVSALTSADKATMFALLSAYYDAVTEEQFLCDLAKKDAVIVLRDASDQRLCGFSTLVTVRVQVEDKTVRGIFSGDTVMEKSYWGQRALGKAFLRYLFGEKLKYPFAPLYWLLISKGYKTYLMMANNFAHYFPCHDRPTPPIEQRLLDAFYVSLYPDRYDALAGLIRATEPACHLKTGVAGISQELIATNPKVAFFVARNPDWSKGAELACLARMTVWMPLAYAIKVLAVDCVIKPLLRLSRGILPLPKKERHANE